MKKTISILGCGWLGKPLAKELIAKSYKVKGSTTSLHKLEALKTLNILPFIVNINSFGYESTGFLNCDVLVIAITSKNKQDYKQLITHISQSKVKEVIFISSTSVYPLNNSIVTEKTPVKDTPLAIIEKLFITNTTFNTTIIRFGGLYGYDREPGHFFKTNKPIKQPQGFINFIHRDDCIAIVHQLIMKGATQNVFNACSDSHPTRRDFYTQAFKEVGRSTPNFDKDSALEYKIINSEKLKQFLNYTFIHKP